jgi:hypothetical protein
MLKHTQKLAHPRCNTPSHQHRQLLVAWELNFVSSRSLPRWGGCAISATGNTLWDVNEPAIRYDSWTAKTLTIFKSVAHLVMMWLLHGQHQDLQCKRYGC